MGYRNPYEEREKRYQNDNDANPGSHKKAKQRLERLFSTSNKSEAESCLNGHTWVTLRDGPVRCSKCKIRKSLGQ